MSHRRVFGTLFLTASLLTFLGPQAEAQRRGGRHGSRSVRSVSFHRPAIGSYYGSLFWPSWGFYEGPWYYPRGYLLSDPAYASIDLRLQVKPEDTEVYVDGFYAGVVDDFDGLFQRLRLPPGEHEIQLYREGHRTVRKTLYLNPGTSYKLEHKMEPLGQGESSEPRPEARSEKPSGERGRGTRERPGAGITEPTSFGVLVVRVQPASAHVLVDHEAWSATPASGEVILHLAEGRHRVEVREEGFQTFETTVEVRAGETSRLNVRLPRRAR
jgi:hypothetical protein